MERYRVGIGYDIHKFVKGKKLFLAGLEINFSYGLKGHSDGDVVLHSICDALLSACGLNDIGELFPDTSKDIKGISSKKIASKVKELVYKNNFKIVNIDSVIICDQPKISPIKNKLLTSLKQIFGVNNINIKGKTTEGKNKNFVEVYSVVLVEKVQ